MKILGHITCNFLSYTFNRTVTINLILPTLSGPDIDWAGDSSKNTHSAKEKYPILYLLHGGINDYSTWERYTSIERYAEARRIAVVTFSAENKGYINLGKDSFMHRDNYYDFVAYELPDFLTSNFPISSDPKHTYIAGLSMGGGGTMLHTFSRPECFRAVGFLSAAVTMGNAVFKFGNSALTEDDRWDNEMLLRKAVAEGKKLPDIYTAMGTKDFGYQKWQESLQVMDELGVKYSADVMAGYGYEWPFWDIQIEKFLDWIPRSDSYYMESPKRSI